MSLEDEIRASLEATFAPTTLVVINESHLHAGHAGDDGSGESHWRVEISAPSLEGKSRMAKHRAVHSALGTGIIGRIHALTLQIT
ncbi:BolA family transcriptional regulator [Octadecabacter sp. G9-8]|uniref:BolA family transcriptional regulator n=1 Tax=Octadecabacter dasysiphoniae TaxID=2909341 RepID=A0ABS9CV01_9RHOB|nr:BolA family protein [Octadecabacter dasysiphoniae]MCF2870239.1 BolA family transcriptional regulator [Octadecabacter dasysiphoniae]